MKTNYKIINLTDEFAGDAILFLSEKKVWKDIVYSNSYIEKTVLSFLSNPKKNLFIALDNENKIVATLGVSRWIILPYYNIILYSCDAKNSIRAFKEISCALWTFVISALESEGRHSFFWCIRDYPLASLKDRKQDLQIKKIVPLLQKYLFNIEEIISGKKESNFEAYKKFFDSNLVNENSRYIIKRATLKPEFFEKNIYKN